MNCPSCGVAMRKHARIQMWTCRRIFCPNFDRPMYERMPVPDPKKPAKRRGVTA